MPRMTLISSMKNEGPFILEWIAYHRVIGFDGIIIGSNDCEDCSDVLLSALAKEGIISHRLNTPPIGHDPQYVFLQEVIDHPYLRSSDWTMVLDADEFLNITYGNGHLDDLIANSPDADAIVVLWKTFGDSGRSEWQNGLTLEEFTACEDCIDDWNRFHKTIFRNNGKFSEMDAHYPNCTSLDALSAINVVNAAGSKYPLSYITKKEPSIGGVQEYSDFWTWDGACINHYPCKTPDLLMMKRHRGDNVPGIADEKYNFESAYGWLRVKNASTDVNIQRQLPKVYDELALLRSSHVIRNAEREMLRAFRALRQRVQTKYTHPGK